MLSKSTENLISTIVCYGAAFTTIFIISGSVNDPVNVPKFLSLGVIACAALGVLVSGPLSKIYKASKTIWISATIFIICAISSVANSDSPLSQGIYGAYGRNNGLLAYFFLAILLIVTVSFTQPGSYLKLIKAFFAAGAVNLVYCLWVIVFGDFIGWSNPYGNILGTLGNPNFIGAFLGMFISSYLAYGIAAQSSKVFKFSLIIVLPLTAFEIVKSHAIQGRVVAAAGFVLVGFFWIRSKYKTSALVTFSGISLLAGVFALLGALQIGPLTSLIYKNSVSLRGQYWLAGWRTGESHPATGVGMDAFGDWYRRSRDVHALELPGVDVVVNASHNVPIDMFAFGGWPLFISYMAIMALGGFSLVRAISRTKEYDPILVILTTAWTGYQLQSIISINQIGLAIWGWVLTGAAIGYEKSTRLRNEVEIHSNKKQIKSSIQNPKAVLFGSLFGVIGLLIALPPLLADSKLRSAQLSRSAPNIENTLMPSYFNPQNSMKFLTNIQDFEKNNLTELSHKYALQGVKWNSESYDMWRSLYLIQNSTSEEKAIALQNMKRLDPLNPELK
jgi:hypothetical protein